MSHNPNYIPMNLLPTYPVLPKDELPELIVCAANQYTYNDQTYIILGTRHGCERMWSQIDTSIVPFEKLEIAETEIQGFITNRQRFVTREEAYQIAKTQGQIKRLCPTGSSREHPELFSEMLY